MTGKGDSTADLPPWFDGDEADYAARLAGLSNQPDLAAAVAQFREKGYLVRDFGFSSDDLDEAAAYTLASPSKRVQDGWLRNSAIRRLATHPRVLEFLTELYQRRPIPFQTLNFAQGTEQAVHSDTMHFDSAPMGFMCGVWIALEDIDPGSGPLVYYPGSQRLPVFKGDDLGGRGYGDGYVPLVARTLEGSGLSAETAPIRRGEAFIWASNLFHGGSPITDPAKTRLSQVTHVYFEGCSYFTPLASQEGQGRIFWREPYDIAERRFVRNARSDAHPRLKYRIGERLKLVLRRPYGSD